MNVTVKQKITVEIDEVVVVPKIITTKYTYFQDVINHLKTLEFLAGSHHNSFKDYLGYTQGGINAKPISYIEFMYEKCSNGYNLNTITVRVDWSETYDEKTSSIIIFKRSGVSFCHTF